MAGIEPDRLQSFAKSKIEAAMREDKPLPPLKPRGGYRTPKPNEEQPDHVAA